MELLLNLVWLAIALTALLVFSRVRKESFGAKQVSYGMALMALICVLVMLFPVVSASDDLHPTQAVLEEATKRIQHFVAPANHAQAIPAGILPLLLVTVLLSGLIAIRASLPVSSQVSPISRARTPREGRSPPSL